MNIKDLLLPILFACSLSFAIQYFFDSKSDRAMTTQQVNSGAGFMAPTIEDVNKPLNTSIKYMQSNSDVAAELTTITTPCGSYIFSNHGAILQAFSFPWQQNTQTITTLAPDANYFFVAFDQQSPMQYSLTNMSGDEQSDRTIEYQAAFDGGIITKLFTIHHDSYQVDLEVNVQYHHGHAIRPVQLRIFLPQPVMAPTVAYDKIAGFVNENQSIAMIDVAKKDSLQRYWAIPSCFGFETRFLAHAFVSNDDNFVQRAYVMKNKADHFAGVLESRMLHESGSWKMKFFVGPKTSQALQKVDARLLKTLNFGWFAPISHVMLSMLQYLHQHLGNYGWAIILLTLLLKLLLLPFTWYGEKNMRKGAEMQQKLAYIQRKYKDNPEMLEQARAELIKKHGMPGLVGCLPLLLTLPMLIGLNTVLSNAAELYGAPFLWISNLYAIDPYYILPIMTGFAMLVTPMDNDPKKGLMRYAMALMMATVSCYFSAGLVLFILVNSLAAAVQTKLQKR